MNWKLVNSSRQDVGSKIQGFFSAGAQYVLVKYGDEFLAIRKNGCFIDSMNLARYFLADMSQDTVNGALQHLLDRAEVEPEHVAILVAIHSDGH